MGRYKSTKLRFAVKTQAARPPATLRGALGWSAGLILACAFAFMIASGTAQTALGF